MSKTLLPGGLAEAYKLIAALVATNTGRVVDSRYTAWRPLGAGIIPDGVDDFSVRNLAETIHPTGIAGWDIGVGDNTQNVVLVFSKSVNAVSADGTESRFGEPTVLNAADVAAEFNRDGGGNYIGVQHMIDTWQYQDPSTNN